MVGTRVESGGVGVLGLCDGAMAKKLPMKPTSKNHDDRNYYGRLYQTRILLTSASHTSYLYCDP